MRYQDKREPLTGDARCLGLLDTGLRVSELANLKRANLDWQTHRLIYIDDPLVPGGALPRSLDRTRRRLPAGPRVARGCPLSPVLGGFFLYALDQQFEANDIFYIRYMDDILILTETRWRLRRAMCQLNQGLTRLRLEKSRPKTFIGKAQKGFDFPGYRFEPGGLSLAPKTEIPPGLRMVDLNAYFILDKEGDRVVLYDWYVAKCAEEEGAIGRQTERKALIVMAVEERGAGLGRIRMQRVRNASAAGLLPFVEESVEPGSVVRTDGRG